MKQLLFILTFALLVGCQSSIRSGIERQLKEYPESRVQDIYSSIFLRETGQAPERRLKEGY